MRPVLGLQRGFQFAFDPVVEHRRVRIGAQGADHQQVAGAEGAGAGGKGQDQIMVDGAKGRLGTGLLDRGAQAAEGDIDVAAQLRQQRGQLADWVLQVRVSCQRPAAGGQYTGHGGLVEQAIEQVFAGQAGGAGEQNALWGQVHKKLSGY